MRDKENVLPVYFKFHVVWN